MIAQKNIRLDLQHPSPVQIIHAKQGDAYTRTINIELYNDGAAWTPPTGAHYKVSYRKPDGTGGTYDTITQGSRTLTAVSASGNILSVSLAPQVLTFAGLVTCEVHISTSATATDDLSTFSFLADVQASAERGITSEDYWNVANEDRFVPVRAELSGTNGAVQQIEASRFLVTPHNGDVVLGTNGYVGIVVADTSSPVTVASSGVLWAALQGQASPMGIPGAGAHNAIYRGYALGSSVTAAQWAAISAGTFDDLYIGDYWTIGGVNYRIAAFDYYLNTGDTACTTHHVVIVPDTVLYNTAYNDDNVVTGGYVGSKLYTQGLATAKSTIGSAFGSTHILSHRQYLSNAVTDNFVTGAAWFDSTVCLMTEQNVYGSRVFGSMRHESIPSVNHSLDNSQLPLFKHRHDLICAARQEFWLRDVVSQYYFAAAGTQGVSSYSAASNDSGIRPAFCIKG